VAELDEPAFARIPCRWRECGAVFFICLPCYRGQRYCSERCRAKARRAQRREANRRYQESERGLERHRERQRAYRRRRVTDQGSSATPPAMRMDAQAPEQAPAREARGEPVIADVLVCQCCGRMGRRIDPFASG
jgi:hypothetical protein